MNNILNVTKLSLQAEKKMVLEGLSFEVNTGDVVAVIGPNGAGKSSLLSAIAGDAPHQNMRSSGEISIAEKPIQQWDKRQLAKHLAYLQQRSSLEFPFTVFDVVSLGRASHDSGIDIDQNIAVDAIRAMDIEHLIAQAYTQLSGGEKQRVQLARVLAQVWRKEDAKQRLLLLDEPTEALDIEHKHKLMATLRFLADAGTAIVLVLHDFSFAAQYANKIIALKDGKMFAHGQVADIMTKKHLENLFNTKIFILPHPLNGKPIIVG